MSKKKKKEKTDKKKKPAASQESPEPWHQTVTVETWSFVDQKTTGF